MPANSARLVCSPLQMYAVSRSDANFCLSICKPGPRGTVALNSAAAPVPPVNFRAVCVPHYANHFHHGRGAFRLQR